MHDDDPGDVVHDAFAEALYGDHPLGRPVIGSVESIEALTAESIAGYYRGRYRAPQMVVSVSGNVDHDTVVRLVSEAFNTPGTAPPSPLRPFAPPPSLSGAVVEDRPTEQAHLVTALWHSTKGSAPGLVDTRG